MKRDQWIRGSRTKRLLSSFAALSALGLGACGHPAWGHEDGFGEALTKGCETRGDCEQLVGAARWRVRQCSSVNREAGACDEANEHQRAAENMMLARREQAQLAEQQAVAQARSVGAEVVAQTREDCGHRERELAGRLQTEQERSAHLQAEVDVLRKQVESAERLAEALKGDALSQ